MTYQDDDGAGIAPEGEPLDGAPDSGGDGDGDSGSTGDVRLDQIVADAEAGLIDPDGDPDDDQDADADQDADRTGDRRGARSKTSPGGGAGKLAKFVQDNYGGDEDAFLAGQYSSRDEARRLSERVRELESKLTTAPKIDLEAEFKTTRGADPDVAAIDQRIEFVDRDIKAIDARQRELATTANTLVNEIKILGTKRDRTTDPDEVRLLERDLYDKRVEYAEMKAEFATNDGRKTAAAARKDDLALMLAQAEKGVRSRLTDKQREQQDLQQSAQQWNADYDNAFTASLSAYDVKPGSDRAKYLYHATRTMLVDWLSQQTGPALDANGMRRATSHLLDSAAKSFNLQRRAPGTPGSRAAARPGQQSRNPRQPSVPGRVADSGQGTRRSTSTPAGGRTPRNREDLLSDPASVRARANAIFEKVAQSGGRGGRGLPS